MRDTFMFINLKRFDVPKAAGGICPDENPGEWARSLVREADALGLGRRDGVKVAFLLPESLVIPAVEAARDLSSPIAMGCQGVFPADVAVGGNFGALTSSRSAKAMRAAGCAWAMIGHSEERRKLLSVMQAYDPEIASGGEKRKAASRAVHALLRASVERAAQAGLHILFCVGETAEEKGSGSSEEQEAATRAILREQIESVFAGMHPAVQLAIGYEPVWAIGPGKNPPGGEYIRFAVDAVRGIFSRMGHEAPPVVYGGGLKLENAAIVAEAGGDGGLIALTRFSGEIGFYPDECAAIIGVYMNALGA